MNLTSLLIGLWRASWQASLLAIVVLIVQKILGNRIGGRGRYALWSVVLIRLLLPALPQSRFSLFNLANISASTPVVQAQKTDSASTEIPIIVIGATHAKPQAVVVMDSSNEHLSSAPQKARISWSAWVFAAWVAGIFILSIRVMQVCWMLSRTMRNLPVASDPRLLHLVRSCAKTLHLGNLPIVLSGESVQTPAVVGLLRPRLLLPQHVLIQCNDREIRLIIMHELAHLKRHDIAGNWLIAVASIVHWFNPIVWLAASRMRADRELACDELVLSHCSNDAQAYGQTLVKLIEILSPAAAPRQLVGILESTTPMKRRVRMIARFKPTQSSRWILTLGVLFALACVALTDAVRGENKPPTAPPVVSTPAAGSPATSPVVSTVPINSNIAQNTETVAYDVNDLIQPNNNQPRETWSQPVIKLVEGFVAPDSWKDNGGTIGSVQELNGKLIIQQTPKAHEKIVELLKLLRSQQSQPPALSQFGTPPMPAQPVMSRTIVSDADIDAANQAALTALQKKLPDVKFDGVPFTDVLDFLRETTGANIVANWRALEVAGIDKNSPITLRLKNVTFEMILSSAMRQLQSSELAMVIDRGVITVTTQFDTPSYMLTKVYDVSDVATSPGNVEALAKVVQGLISPGDSVQSFDSKLIITALPDMHAQIVKLLTDLRAKPTAVSSNK